MIRNFIDPNNRFTYLNLQRITLSLFEKIIEQNNIEFLNFLLNDIPQEQIDLFYNDNYPIHIACQKNNIAICQNLLKDTTLNQFSTKNKLNNTPLYYAVINQNIELVKFLLGKSANPNEKVGKENLPILHFALMHNDLQIIRILISHGAKVTLLNPNELKEIQLLELREGLIKTYPIYLKILKANQIAKTDITNTEEPYATNSTSTPKTKTEILKDTYTPKDWKNFREEDKARKENMFGNSTHFYKPSDDIKITETFSWCGGLFNETHQSVKRAEHNPSNPDSYCYFDAKLLQEQSFDLTKLNNIRLVFDDDHIKKLANNIIFTETVMLNGKLQEIVYTHELRFSDSEERILLFALPADNGNGCLYVGARYLEKGLHTQGDIKAVQESTKHAQLTVTLPNQNRNQTVNNLSETQRVKI